MFIERECEKIAYAEWLHSASVCAKFYMMMKSVIVITRVIRYIWVLVQEKRKKTREKSSNSKKRASPASIYVYGDEWVGDRERKWATHVHCTFYTLIWRIGYAQCFCLPYNVCYWKIRNTLTRFASWFVCSCHDVNLKKCFPFASFFKYYICWYKSTM